MNGQSADQNESDDEEARATKENRFPPPTEEDIQLAKSRIGSKGPKFTTEEVIAMIEAL